MCITDPFTTALLETGQKSHISHTLAAAMHVQPSYATYGFKIPAWSTGLLDNAFDP